MIEVLATILFSLFFEGKYTPPQVFEPVTRVTVPVVEARKEVPSFPVPVNKPAVETTTPEEVPATPFTQENFVPFPQPVFEGPVGTPVEETGYCVLTSTIASTDTYGNPLSVELTWNITGVTRFEIQSADSANAPNGVYIPSKSGYAMFNTNTKLTTKANAEGLRGTEVTDYHPLFRILLEDGKDCISFTTGQTHS